MPIVFHPCNTAGPDSVCRLTPTQVRLPTNRCPCAAVAASLATLLTLVSLYAPRDAAEQAPEPHPGRLEEERQAAVLPCAAERPKGGAPLSCASFAPKSTHLPLLESSKPFECDLHDAARVKSWQAPAR